MRTAALVCQYNFDIPVVYHGGAFYESESAERTISQILATADAAKEVHAGWINTNPNPKPKRERKTDVELDTEVRYLNRLGEHLKSRGMRLMVHNHDADLTEGGSDRLLDALVAWGSVNAIRTRVAEHLDAGADHVCVQPLPPADFRLDQLRELAPALLDL